jgi:hypothetical protein
VIPVVSKVRLTELERWVSEEMTEHIATRLSLQEQRAIRRRRPRAIGERLAPFEANARLCLAFAKPQMRVLRRKPPGPRAERDRLTEELFERSKYCCQLLAFAKAVRTLMPWDSERMLQFHREVVVVELRELLRAFLKLAGSHAVYHRDALLNYLECWELSEEFCSD